MRSATRLSWPWRGDWMRLLAEMARRGAWLPYLACAMTTCRRLSSRPQPLPPRSPRSLPLPLRRLRRLRRLRNRPTWYAAAVPAPSQSRARPVAIRSSGASSTYPLRAPRRFRWSWCKCPALPPPRRRAAEAPARSWWPATKLLSPTWPPLEARRTAPSSCRSRLLACLPPPPVNSSPPCACAGLLRTVTLRATTLKSTSRQCLALALVRSASCTVVVFTGRV